MGQGGAEQSGELGAHGGEGSREEGGRAKEEAVVASSNVRRYSVKAIMEQKRSLMFEADMV